MTTPDDRVGVGPPRNAEEAKTRIYLCKWCGEVFEPGDDVVALSDGKVDAEERLNVENRRFWHRECWIEDLTQ